MNSTNEFKGPITTNPEGIVLNLNEEQKKLLNQYIEYQNQLYNFKSILEIDQKMIDDTMAKYNQYKVYTKDLHPSAAEKLKKIGLSAGMDMDFSKIESELFTDIMRYSVAKTEYDKIEKKMKDLDAELTAAFGDIITEIFSNTFSTTYTQQLIDNFKEKDFDDKFAERVNEAFISEGIPNDMLMRNARLEEITLAAIKYLLNVAKA